MAQNTCTVVPCLFLLLLQVDACLSKLRDALKLEVKLAETLQKLSGCLEPILAAALAGTAPSVS